MAGPPRKPIVTLPSFRELWPEYSSQIAPPSSDPPNTEFAQFTRERATRIPIPQTWDPPLYLDRSHAPIPYEARSSWEGVHETRTPSREESGTFPVAVSNPSHTHDASSPAREALRRRFVCATCGKGFTRPSSLRQHHNSHTGEKPFECPYPGCGRRYTVKSNMKRHQVSHALQQPVVTSSPSVTLDCSPYGAVYAGIHTTQNESVVPTMPFSEQHKLRGEQKRAGSNQDARRSYKLPTGARTKTSGIASDPYHSPHQ